MGIIKKILGAVFGLLAALGGLLGIGGKGKSDSGYFLDLSQDKAVSSAAAPTPQRSITPNAGAQAVAEVPTAASTEAATPENLPKLAASASDADQVEALQAEKTAAEDRIRDEQQKLEALVSTTQVVSFADIVRVPVETMAKRRPGPSLAGFQEMAKEIAPRR